MDDVTQPGAVRTAWLITGVPGAGKSTVAGLLARRLPRAAHIEGDALAAAIRSGAVLPGQEPNDESRRQMHLVVQQQCLLARSFADAGFVPVIDYVVVERTRLGRYRDALALFDVRVVVLDPDPETVLRRDRSRPKGPLAPAFLYLRSIMQAELAGVGLWIDTSALTAEETVGRILAEQERARLVD
ncbi:MAG: AAA family ATPase [Chloroflexi bacterium]|nr:AAA family ATPase [Chloroflexota bacterium]